MNRPSSKRSLFETVKKRSAIQVICGAVIGVIIVLLCLIIRENIKENARLKACLERDYSFVDLTKADLVKTDSTFGTTYYFDDLTVNIAGEDIVFTDS